MKRFWDKVDKGLHCWEWKGYRDPQGYGRFLIGSRRDGSRKVDRPHRVVWRLTYGPIPDGMLVCHRCDNPSCVRPAHLFLGSHADNMQDMCSKGRHGKKGAPPGSRHPNARLTETHITEMRRLRSEGWKQQQLASRYGVSQTQVSRILLGKRWAHHG